MILNSSYLNLYGEQHLRINLNLICVQWCIVGNNLVYKD